MTLTDDEVKEVMTYGTIAVTGPQYYLPSTIEIDEFLLSNKVSYFLSHFVFEKDVADCSWAAWGFVWLFVGMGWAVSYEVLRGHALVRILDNQKEEVWIEPQTGRRVENNRKLILTVMP